ncbi:MAG: type II secretion system protein GspC [Myxococcota bacterium]|nr:type II secretion system protein GspC [Myxococcota bacterium]
MREHLSDKRVWIGAGVIALASFAAAAGLNLVVIKPKLALPDDAELPSVGEFVADAGSDGPDIEDGGRAPAPRPRATSESRFLDIIVKGNIFDSSKVGQEPEAELIDDGSGRKTKLDLVLIATMVAEPAQFSSALISGKGKDDRAFGYGVEDEIMGATILEIQQKAVKLEVNGEVEWLYMDPGAVKEPKAATASNDRSLLRDDDAEDGITESGGKIIVERRVVDEALANVETLATKMRVVPHKGADGQIDGYRLSAIRRGSLFDKLGIKNGDVVHGVNGMPLTSTDGAFQAFQTLQSESAFTFEVTRRNQRQTFEYEVR